MVLFHAFKGFFIYKSFHINNSLGVLGGLRSTLRLMKYHVLSFYRWHRWNVAVVPPGGTLRKELEHAGAQEKSQASEQDTLEKEKEAKEVGSTLSAFGHRMRFHILHGLTLFQIIYCSSDIMEG